MARRNLRIGDDLSGRTLYFTINGNNPDAVDSLSVTKEQYILGTTTNWSLSTGGNSYSLGDRYYFGLYNPDDYWSVVEGSLWTMFPEITLMQWTNYSGGSHGVVESGPQASIVCPNDFGAICYLDTNSAAYSFLEIDDAETTTAMFLGDIRVSALYVGTQKIDFYSNIGQCKENFFVINDWDWFYFEEGQTWQQWIDQAKYWDPEDEYSTWGYSGNSVLRNGNPVDRQTPSTKIGTFSKYYSGLACLSGDTLIQTENGNQPISILQVGDKLTNDNQIEKSVMHTRNYYYEITFDNGDIIKASNDHQFVCDGIIIKTEELQIGYVLNDLTITNIKRIDETLDMYEIKTTTNQYTLFNGIVCESENI